MQSAHFPKGITRVAAAHVAGQQMEIDFIMCCCDLIEWFVAQLSTRSVQWEWWVPRVQLSPSLLPAVTVSEPLAMSTGPSSIINIYQSVCAPGVGGRVLTAPQPCLLHPSSSYVSIYPGSGTCTEAESRPLQDMGTLCVLLFSWVEGNIDSSQLEIAGVVIDDSLALNEQVRSLWWYSNAESWLVARYRYVYRSI